jgi:hypothetical protein
MKNYTTHVHRSRGTHHVAWFPTACAKLGMDSLFIQTGKGRKCAVVTVT